MYRAGQLPVNRPLTRLLRLDEISGGFDLLGFDLLDWGEAIRQVVVCDHD